MKLEHIVALAIRLFAFAIAYQALRSVISLQVFMRDNDSTSALVAYVGSTICLILLALILWKFPLIIAKKIAKFPAIDDSEVNSEDADRLLQTGLFILGVYFLFYAISDLVFWSYMLGTTSSQYSGELELTLEQKSAITSTIVEMGMALILTLGSKRVVQLTKVLRNGDN